MTNAGHNRGGGQTPTTSGVSVSVAWPPLLLPLVLVDAVLPVDAQRPERHEEAEDETQAGHERG
jgi:hypothetical protein